MEAVFLISVKDFPAFVIIDDKGNDFFENLPASSAQHPTGTLPKP